METYKEAPPINTTDGLIKGSTTSPTPLTVEEIVERVCMYSNPETLEDVHYLAELSKVLREMLTTLTTQHTKEKEEIFREILAEQATFGSDDGNGSKYEIYFVDVPDIKEIAKNHNITI